MQPKKMFTKKSRSYIKEFYIKGSFINLSNYIIKLQIAREKVNGVKRVFGGRNLLPAEKTSVSVSFVTNSCSLVAE